MPSLLAYWLGLMSHLGSTFSKNDGPGPCPGGQNFYLLCFSQNVLKRALGALGGPWRALGPLFPLFFHYFSPFFLPCGGPYFSFYNAVISPPISPLKAAALV